MYSKSIPFKDFKGNPRNATVQFNLTEPEVFKLLVPLQAIFDWQESLRNSGERELTTEEVVEFYNNFEEVLLSAWGEMSEDGLHFRKAGRYEFEESALFAACMNEFVTNPEETQKLIDGIMPKGLQEMVKKADANVSAIENNPNVDDELKVEIARLRAQLEQKSENN